MACGANAFRMWAGLTTLLIAALVAAQDITAAKIDVWGFIKLDVFEAFCDNLQLSEPQRVSADANYAAYVAAMVALNARYLDDLKRISDEVGWAPEGYIPPGYENFHPDHFRNRRVRLPEQALEVSERSNELVAEVLDASHQIEERLWSAIASTLADAQQEMFPAALRGLRRNAFFAGTPHERAVIDDLISTPDLHALLKAAAEPEGELHPYFEESPDPERARRVRDQISDVMRQFEMEFDAQLTGRFDKLIERTRRAIEAQRANDRSAERDISRQSFKRWERRYDLIQNASAQIAAVLADVGDDGAASAWLDRVNAKWYPVLFQRESTEAVYDWMRQNHPDALGTVGEELLAGYLVERQLLRSEAMKIGVELRRIGVEAFVNQTDHEPLLRRKVGVEERRRALCERTNEALRSLLAEDQKPAFDTVLAEFRRSIDTRVRRPPP